MTLAAASGAAVANTLIIYVVCPLFVLSVVGIGAWLRSMNAKIATQDKALALIINEVLPAGRPSLRDLVNVAQGDANATKQRLNDLISPATLNLPPGLT